MGFSATSYSVIFVTILELWPAKHFKFLRIFFFCCRTWAHLLQVQLVVSHGFPLQSEENLTGWALFCSGVVADCLKIERTATQFMIRGDLVVLPANWPVLDPEWILFVILWDILLFSDLFTCWVTEYCVRLPSVLIQ